PRPSLGRRAARTSDPGVEHVLLLRQPRSTVLKEFRGLALIQLQAAGVTWIEVLHLEALAFGDQRVDVLPYTVLPACRNPFRGVQSTAATARAHIPTMHLRDQCTSARYSVAIARCVSAQAQRKPDQENSEEHRVAPDDVE